MRFSRYHALGNDYIVLDPREWPELSPQRIRLICHRNFGIGSDGILWGPLPAEEADFGLRIFNPDGSEAEKSGNGLRIFSRYLYDQGTVDSNRFSIFTAGGRTEAEVEDAGRVVTVEMGQISFDSTKIPVNGPAREVLREEIVIDGEPLTFSAATIGNPHCVIETDETNAADARRLGPRLESHPLFPNRTNVQFLQVVDRHSIRIEIWERGAGYTLASGSSSSAAAAVAHRLGYCDRNITVSMPGGAIEITIGDNYSVRMKGAVTKIAEGSVDPEMFENLAELLSLLLPAGR